MKHLKVATNSLPKTLLPMHKYLALGMNTQLLLASLGTVQAACNLF